MKKAYWFLLKLFLTVAILTALIINIGLKNLLLSLQTIHYSWFAAVAALIFIELLVGAFNVYILIRYGLRHSISFAALFDAYLTSWGIGLLTPGKVGDVGFAYFLEREGLPFGKGTAVLLLDSFTTILVLAVASGTGLWYFFGFQDVLLLLIVVGIVFLSLLLLLSFQVRALLIRILGKWAIYFRGFSKSASVLLRERPQILVFNFGITIVKWFLIFLNFYFGFKALGHVVPYFVILLVAPLARLVSMIPLTINGLGIRESVAVYLFDQFAIPSGVVLSTYFSMLILNYLFAAVLVFSYSFFRRRA
ncbi:MAG TPA: lysylphosphatidylglycerol synthase transmembrane domain-containing protein [Candidatus Nanoarchaeia archaeon]|nr:lysylphosphatidylglycerol synthase transmembrane domain-containing protein [Candidatus Nanoarchaeia archaeon]